MLRVLSFGYQRIRREAQRFHDAAGREGEPVLDRVSAREAILRTGTWKQVKTMLKHLSKVVLRPPTQGIDMARLLPHVKLSPETLSVYARKQSQMDRICTIEALALFLQECGEAEAGCEGLIHYLHL